MDESRSPASGLQAIMSVVCVLMLVLLLDGPLNYSSSVFRRSIQSVRRSQNRPIISGLKLVLAYYSARPFVIELCCIAILVHMLCKAAWIMSRVPCALIFLPVVLHFEYMTPRILGHLGKSTRAILNYHCDRIAREYRWDRFMADLLELQQQRQGVFARIVLSWAEQVHVSSTTSGWQDKFLREFRGSNIMGIFPNTYEELRWVYARDMLTYPDRFEEDLSWAYPWLGFR
ncbi:hypothetical protein F5Y13DRAFT_192358 [Hypoxylon sp. FL1857]|nr:hypothetical protein F5Y13DRAFT_192358 [Hypoxylon sp. FL1857]